MLVPIYDLSWQPDLDFSSKQRAICPVHGIFVRRYQQPLTAESVVIT